MFKPERLAAFCDGVIAIAITLLVLGLEVPSVHDVPERELNQYLQASMHSLVGYVVSFILVGTYWLQHYVVFHFIDRVDRTLVLLNGVFLLCISFVPFPTGLQATYRHDELAMILYAGTQVACGLSLLAIWIHVSKDRRLITDAITPEQIKSMSWRISVTPLVGLAAMAVSLINLDLSRILFLIIPAAYFSHRAVDGSSVRRNHADR
jgi:uncharacterized membrane protein